MTIDTFKRAEIFLHVVISKRKLNDHNDDFKKSAVKIFRTIMLTMLANDDLKKLRNSNIRSMSISQTMITTALMTDDTASTRTDISTSIIYCKIIEDSV